jgi:hypothetical protein
VLKGQLVLRVQLVPKGLQGQLVLPEPLAHKGLLVQLVLKALQEQPVQLARRELPVLRVAAAILF